VLTDFINPTPYPEVNIVLQELQKNARAILGDQFFAMYLYGSLSSGDFNPETSDVDFLIVTHGQLSPEMIGELEKMHMRLGDSGGIWAERLEGRYMPKDDLRRFQPDRAPNPTINERQFYLDGEGNDWIIQRHVIRESGVTLAGPPPETLIDPVPHEHLKQSVLRIMDEWWAPMLDKPEFLKNGGYQAFAVLTMCRTLYTLEHGLIASKPVSARWAMEALDGRWNELIERSLVMEHDSPIDILNETLEFIRFTRDHCQRFERRAV
jgi:hypothetical protein